MVTRSTFRKSALAGVLLCGSLVGANPGQASDTPTPTSVTIAGSLQSELGCPGDWDPSCSNSRLSYDAGDAVWQATFPVPAGNWEYKAALDDSWDEHYGAGAVSNGANIGLDLSASTDVKFYYDHESHWVTDNINSAIATVAGSFQAELGCPGDWQPDCLRTWLQDPDGDGVYTFATDQIPAGDHEFKIARDEGWAESYPAANVAFTAVDGSTVTITYDSATDEVSVDPGEPPSSSRFDYAIIHYNRPAGDYGDHTTGNFADFWGLHLWGDAIDPSEATEWAAPKPFEGEDEFGRFAWIKRGGDDSLVNFLIHRGDAKDTNPDRGFDADATPEVWVNEGDETIYTNQADAQGYATIRYQRDDGDYGDMTSPDFNDFWGLHLWGDAIDPSTATEWTAPLPPDGVDDYGAYWNVPIVESKQPVNFIIHRGDAKDPGPDESFIPADVPTVWKQSGDTEIYPSRGAAEDIAVIHYHRLDGDYGDTTSSDFNDFWGLHVWQGSVSPTEWSDPVRPTGFDVFGPRFEVPVQDGAPQLAYIIHRGHEKDSERDQFLSFDTWGYEAWQLSGESPSGPDEPHYVLPIRSGATLDTQPPTWDVPDDITAEATSVSGAAVVYTAVPSDNVEVVSSACVPASGSTFTLGTTVVTCTASDAAGNSGTASFNVTVRDTQPPSWDVPADMTELATGIAGAPVIYTASAADTVGVVASSCVPMSGATFPLGTTNVNCTASDAAGNTGNASFMVTIVVDDTSFGTLIEGIEAAGLSNEVERSLTGPLNQADKLISDSNPQNDGSVCRKLDSFLGHVQRRLDDGSIDPTFAAQLSSFAVAIESALGCT